ncbi:MAG: hypothetical protein ACJ789_07760, partial [Thermomicrobiales bacterium]
VHAVDCEAELWRIMHATLLDPDYLSGGLQAGLAQHQEADRIRSERMAAIETQLTQQRRRLEAHVDKFVQAGDGEFAATIRRRADDIEALITQLTAQRAELAAVRSDGLSVEEATAITTIADEIRAGLDQATSEERRHLIELFDVRGTVHLDPNGIKLGRKHRFRIEWQARIPLRDRAGQFQNWYAT